MQARRWAVGGLGTVSTVLVGAAAAWACVAGPAVNLSTVNAKPGEEVSVTGANFPPRDPVTVRWNSLDGPVLATLSPPDADRHISGRFTVPLEAGSGSYVLIFTRSAPEPTPARAPVRALITVTRDGGDVPAAGVAVEAPEDDRAASLLSGSTVAATALGITGLGTLLASIAALAAGRRGRLPEAVRAGR